MASSSTLFLFTVPLLFFIVIFPELGYGVAAVPIEELEAMNRALRSKGYNRIGNAIATSDLTFDLLSANAVTLFAPSDSSLYDLDMTLSAAAYVSVLRFHAVPRRLTVTDLHSSVLPTLLSNSSLNVTVDKFNATVSINGVQLETPGIYNGSQVTVHGLSGALKFFSSNGRTTTVDSEVGSPENGAPNPLPPAPPFEAPRAPTPTSIEGAYPMWILPPEPQMNMSPFSDIPQVASQLQRTSPGRRRKLSPITKSQSQVPSPSPDPSAHGNVNDRYRLPERVKTDKEARHLHQIMSPLIEGDEPGPSIDQNLHRSLFQTYAADPYSIWNDNGPLCNRECTECKICLSQCSSCS